MTRSEVEEKLEKLAIAGDLLVDVLSKLNTDQYACDSCGHVASDCWEEKQAHNALTGALGRVERAGSLLWEEYGDGRFPLKGRWRVERK